MASVMIRDLPEKTKRKLAVRAAEQGMSLEAYLRLVLHNASMESMVGSMDILDAADRYFGVSNGIDLDLPERNSTREIVDFES